MRVVNTHPRVRLLDTHVRLSVMIKVAAAENVVSDFHNMKMVRLQLVRALRLEVAKDAFHLETTWELVTRLKDLHMEEAKERQAQMPPSKHGNHLQALKETYSQYVPLVRAAAGRQAGQHVAQRGIGSRRLAGGPASRGRRARAAPGRAR